MGHMQAHSTKIQVFYDHEILVPTTFRRIPVSTFTILTTLFEILKIPRNFANPTGG